MDNSALLNRAREAAKETATLPLNRCGTMIAGLFISRFPIVHANSWVNTVSCAGPREILPRRKIEPRYIKRGPVDRVAFVRKRLLIPGITAGGNGVLLRSLWESLIRLC